MCDTNGNRREITKVGNYQRVPSAASRWSGSSGSRSPGDGRTSGAAWSENAAAGKGNSSATAANNDVLPSGSEIKQRNANQNPTNIKPLACNEIAERGRKLKLANSKSSEPLIVDDDSDYDEDEEDWEEISRIAVPLTVSLFIIGLYIIGGAILFKYWEGWDMAQSSYFCFITLSTIGFGDVTPGRDYSDPMANAKLIMGSLYSIFGMAILSMCFTLMQEEMLAKFTWLGRKLGVVDKDEDDAELQGTDDTSYRNNDNRNQSEC